MCMWLGSRLAICVCFSNLPVVGEVMGGPTAPVVAHKAGCCAGTGWDFPSIKKKKNVHWFVISFLRLDASLESIGHFRL